MATTNEKPTKKEVAEMLTEALMPFCETLTDLRPELAAPFRQKDGDGCDCICASDGRVLIRIRCKEAGVAVGPFKAQEKPDVSKVIPAVGFDDLLQARTVSRSDLADAIDTMKRHEDTTQQPASADLGGIRLTMEAVSHLEVAMRICGSEQARLAWAKNGMVLLQLLDQHSREAVSILHMGLVEPKYAPTVTIPTGEGCDGGALFAPDWQRGIKAWADMKAELAAREEAERMARREVYMVLVVKRAYVPVYARNADEAQKLLESDWMDPEDDGDDEWMLGDEVPEAEDVDDIADCYENILTRDGIVSRDDIYELDQISEDWEKEHKED